MHEKIAIKLYKWLENLPRKPDGILYNSNVREDLLALEPTGDIAKRQREYVTKKLSLCCLVFATSVFLSLLLWIKGTQNREVVDNRIYREDYDGSTQILDLTASDGTQSTQLELELSPRQLSDEELGRLYEEFIPKLEQAILAENESLDCVSYDLNLVSALDGYPFKVEWIPPEDYMDTGGRLLLDEVGEPVTTQLQARISYMTFRAQYEAACCIYDRTEPLGMKEKLAAELKKTDTAEPEREYVTLPEEFQDKALTWSRTKNNTGLLFLFMTPLLSVLLYMMKDKDLHKEVELRAEEMQADYPDIVSKLSLLISAGMTVQAAWLRVAQDYRREAQRTGRKRFAYEEMLLSVHEMENGASARDALERFGRRCRLSGYTRMSTLLAQNLSKGSANLAAMLQAEASEAFEERKHAARKSGEKAGTKLLLPMMLLLGIVMVIITVPALTSC